MGVGEDHRLAELVRGQTLLFKLGGSIGGEDTLPEDVALLQRLGARVTLVHGGGPRISSWLERMGKQTHFVGGLRYTDPETLEVVRMVLGGLVNGEVVARIGAAGGRAVGLTGADDRLLEAEVRDRQLGLVGEVAAVNPQPIHTLLDAGYIVVVAPLAVSADGSFLNVNADTAAAEIAVALGATRLVFLTDVDGISDGSEPVRRLSPAKARQLISQGIVAEGMIPKVEGSVRVVGAGRAAQIVNGRRPHAALQALTSPEGVGTLVRDD